VENNYASNDLFRCETCRKHVSKTCVLPTGTPWLGAADFCTKPLLWRYLAIAITTRSSPSVEALYRCNSWTTSENYSSLAVSVAIWRRAEFRGNANFSLFGFRHETTTLALPSDRNYSPIVTIFGGLTQITFVNKVRELQLSSCFQSDLAPCWISRERQFVAVVDAPKASPVVASKGKNFFGKWLCFKRLVSMWNV